MCACACSNTMDSAAKDASAERKVQNKTSQNCAFSKINCYNARTRVLGSRAERKKCAELLGSSEWGLLLAQPTKSNGKRTHTAARHLTFPHARSYPCEKYDVLAILLDCHLLHLCVKCGEMPLLPRGCRPRIDRPICFIPKEVDVSWPTKMGMLELLHDEQSSKWPNMFSE